MTRDERELRRFRDFDTPEDVRDSTFLDALTDVFTPPEHLKLRRPDFGYMARVRDMDRIGEDFRKAIAGLGLDKIDLDEIDVTDRR